MENGRKFKIKCILILYYKYFQIYEAYYNNNDYFLTLHDPIRYND